MAGAAKAQNLVTVQYANPDIIDSKIEGEYSTNSKEVDLTALNSNLDTYLKFLSANKAEFMSGTAPEKYRWSLLENIGLPMYTYVAANHLGLILNSISKLQSANLSVLIRPPRGLANDDSTYYYDALSPHLHIIGNSNKPLKKDVDINDGYKIHLMVKDDYLFYGFIKMANILASIFPKNRFILKCSFQSRTGRLLPGDTRFTTDDLNSGPTASIVAYTQANEPKVFRDILLKVIDAFKNDEAVIGLLPIVGGPETIPFANIRINHMICFAKGDRNTKSDIRIKNTKGPISKKYFPQWFTDMQKCESPEMVNSRSQLFFGIDFCSPVPKVYDEGCTDKICYLDIVPKNLVDPSAFNKAITDGRFFPLIDPNTIIDTPAASGGRRLKGSKRRTLRKRKTKGTL